MDRPKEDDRELIQFKELYKSNAPMLIFYAGKYVNAITAEDLVQDVFISLLESDYKFKTENDIKYFLYSSLKNKCISHSRKQKVRDKYY
mgnify:FL=1